MKKKYRCTRVALLIGLSFHTLFSCVNARHQDQYNISCKRLVGTVVMLSQLRESATSRPPSVSFCTKPLLYNVDNRLDNIPKYIPNKFDEFKGINSPFGAIRAMPVTIEGSIDDGWGMNRNKFNKNRSMNLSLL